MADHHIIPQQMIRQFANSRGELAELLKPELTLGTRWKRPKGILWSKDYYRYPGGDLDASLIRPIEQRFVPVYRRLTSEQPSQSIVGPDADALFDWVAAMLMRTPFVVRASEAIARKDSPDLAKAFEEEPSLMTALHRKMWFDGMRALVADSGWKWKLLGFKGIGELVLTDNPVLLVKMVNATGFSVMVPLTKHRLLLGSSEIPSAAREDVLRATNCQLVGWAERHIFAARMETLRGIARVLGQDNDWSRQARRPLFGFEGRIHEIASPTAEQLRTFWSSVMPAAVSSALESTSL